MPTYSKRFHYRSVTLPEPLVLEVEKYISGNPEEGYTSVAEFIKIAIREKLTNDNYQKQFDYG